MELVKVKVLKPFGPNETGQEVEVEKDRLSFLEENGLVEKSGSSSPEKTGIAADEKRIEESIEKLSSNTQFPRTDGESVADYLDRLVLATAGEETPQDTYEKDPFKKALIEAVGEAKASKVSEAGVSSFEDLAKEENIEKLKAIEGFGPATLESLKALAPK